MKKFAAVLLAAATLSTALLSGGCAKKTATTSGSSAADDSQPITLSITWWGSQSRHTYTQKLLDMYKQLHPNVSFQATPAGFDGYEQKLSAEAAGNSLPDIIQMGYDFINTFTKNGTLTDLAPYIKDKTIDLSNVDANTIAAGKIGNKTAGVVIGTGALAITINPDIWKKAGLDTPPQDFSKNWTWEDYVNDMITIKQKTGVYGETELYSASAAYIFFTYYLRQYNCSFFATSGNKLGYTDDKYFVNYATMLKKLQDAGAAPNPDQETQINAKGKEARPVVTGQAGSIAEWANFSTIVSGTTTSLQVCTMPNDNTKVKPMFMQPNGFWSISSSSKYKKQAAAFISWYTNSLDANKVISAERGVPISSKIRDEMKSSLSPTVQRMFEYCDAVAKNSTKSDAPAPQGAAEVEKDFSTELSSVLYGKETPAQAAATFRSQANSVLSRNSVS